MEAKGNKVDVAGTEVTFRASSAYEATEAAAMLENGELITRTKTVRERVAEWLTGAGDFFTEAGRTIWPAIALVTTIVAATIAASAWYGLFPFKNLNLVLGAVGIILILAIARMAATLPEAIDDKDWSEVWGAGIASVLFIMLNMVATVSFQVTGAMNVETGRTDISQEIQALERQKLPIQTRLSFPQLETVEQVELGKKSFLQVSAVNANGTTLTQTVGEMVPECPGNTFYHRTYCPTILEIEQRLSKAQAYENDQVAFAELEAQIKILRETRPAATGPIAAAQRVFKFDDEVMAYFIGALIMFLLEVVLGWSWYQTARAARRKQRKAGAAT